MIQYTVDRYRQIDDASLTFFEIQTSKSQKTCTLHT